MTITEKNAKKRFVDTYLQTYSPYVSHPLGVNVSAVIKLAKEKGCSVNELTDEDIHQLNKNT